MPVDYSVSEGLIGELSVNVLPSGSGNQPGEGVISKGHELVVNEIKDQSGVVGNIGVGGSWVGVLLIIPLQKPLD